MAVVSAINFEIEKRLKKGLGRAGILGTPHGNIKTPSFVIVGTKATVKTLSPEEVKKLGGQIVLGNTYHLYLELGEELIKREGGLSKFMNWNGPTMTDSGGFQAFSLGAAYGKGISKILKPTTGRQERDKEEEGKKIPLAKITDDGVKFKSPIDGSEHFFSPEKSIDIQHNIGADMMFAFDECTSPNADYNYQKRAMNRTHDWAERCVEYHKKNKDSSAKQGLFGIVQGGRFSDLREGSARYIAKLPFAGFGIGGSFEKEDIDKVVGLVNKILPEEKPRHLLGIGEPLDLFLGVENGVDTFDCVTPTRNARNGSLYTGKGRMNILNTKFRQDTTPIEKDCECYTCSNYTRAYLAHLFRSKETFGLRLASIHNLYFIVNLVRKIRESILNDNFSSYKKEFLKNYGG